MVVVTPTIKIVEGLEGLHLFHGAISNHSMRVGMTLIEKVLHNRFTKLNAALEGNPWIMGDQCALADMSWGRWHFTMAGAGYPFEQVPNLTRWATDFQNKKSYQEGILKWCADFAKA